MLTDLALARLALEREQLPYARELEDYQMAYFYACKQRAAAGKAASGC